MDLRSGASRSCCDAPAGRRPHHARRPSRLERRDLRSMLGTMIGLLGHQFAGRRGCPALARAGAASPTSCVPILDTRHRCDRRFVLFLLSRRHSPIARRTGLMAKAKKTAPKSSPKKKPAAKKSAKPTPRKAVKKAAPKKAQPKKPAPKKIAAKRAVKPVSKTVRRPAPKPVAKAAARIARTPRPVGAPDANLLTDLLKWAKDFGADSADALYVNGESISVAQRLGKREKLESSEGRDLGLRVFVGKRQAFVSSTDFAPASLRELAEPRRRHGARRAGGSGLRPRARGTAGPLVARPRPRRQDAARRPGSCSPWPPKPKMPRAPSRASPIPKAPRPAGAAPPSCWPPATASPAAIAAAASRCPARCWAAKAPAWSATTSGPARSTSKT